MQGQSIVHSPFLIHVYGKHHSSRNTALSCLDDGLVSDRWETPKQIGEERTSAMAAPLTNQDGPGHKKREDAHRSESSWMTGRIGGERKSDIKVNISFNRGARGDSAQADDTIMSPRDRALIEAREKLRRELDPDNNVDFHRSRSPSPVRPLPSTAHQIPPSVGFERSTTEECLGRSIRAHVARFVRWSQSPHARFGSPRTLTDPFALPAQSKIPPKYLGTGFASKGNLIAGMGFEPVIHGDPRCKMGASVRIAPEYENNPEWPKLRQYAGKEGQLLREVSGGWGWVANFGGGEETLRTRDGIYMLVYHVRF